MANILGALGIWARRSRHGMAVRSVPGGKNHWRHMAHQKEELITVVKKEYKDAK
ncbi:hypothetical protein PILCRDRAFT_826235 [Piloderma croceum F 1598]|uniref:Uncharacterized protein n=1 Tax=Piloderma croceum (strain F 1598) TaxID=765440 RepID=A0A0C3BGI0_PILCF|nr:hypothetical protein PILCRDRAFT_826235 [Piloderma croceum F 1598]